MSVKLDWFYFVELKLFFAVCRRICENAALIAL
jgi:hypothetical protein